MTNFRNLKISINDQQPIDEVVRELERLRYKRDWIFIRNDFNKVIVTFEGCYHALNTKNELPSCYKLTTLAELKEM